MIVCFAMVSKKTFTEPYTDPEREGSLKQLKFLLEFLTVAAMFAAIYLIGAATLALQS